MAQQPNNQSHHTIITVVASWVPARGKHQYMMTKTMMTMMMTMMTLMMMMMVMMIGDVVDDDVVDDDDDATEARHTSQPCSSDRAKTPGCRNMAGIVLQSR